VRTTVKRIANSLFNTPLSVEAELFSEKIHNENAERVTLTAILLIVFYGLNLIVDLLYFNRIGKEYYLYLDIIVVSGSLIFLVIVFQKRTKIPEPGVFFSLFLILWAAGLAVFQKNIVPFYISLFVVAVLFSINVKRSILVYAIGGAGYYSAYLIRNNFEISYVLSIELVLETLGIVLLAWVTSRIIFSSKVREFRYRRRIESVNRGKEATIRERTKALRILNSELEEKVKEREVLLREVHHRVKNNLQIIISLLNLGIDHKDRRPPEELIIESKNRILSMAIIHEKLYQSENFARINLKEYLCDISNYLVLSHGDQEGGPKDVRFRMDIEDIDADLDEAMTLGLITTELIRNSLKHAFVPVSHVLTEKLLTIRLSRESETTVLQVSDNGVGFTPGTEQQNGLGLVLINSLAEQLGARYEFSSIANTCFKGTCFTLIYPDMRK
jgi:two-component sensor histidine kinase